MKKLLPALFFAGILLGSCSDDNGSSAETTNVTLIKKLTQTIYDGESSEIQVADFVYDGGNLESFTYGSRTTEFEYEGQKVLTQKTFINGVLDHTNNFIYNGDVLTEIQGDNGYRTVFSYDSTHAMTLDSQFFDEDVWETIQTQHYEFSGGNAFEKSDIRISPFSSESRTEYQYDDHSNPARDMNPYLRQLFSFEGILAISTNNIISSQTFSPLTSTTPNSAATYEITYELDFPILIKKFINGNLTTQTAIEYSITSVTTN